MAAKSVIAADSMMAAESVMAADSVMTAGSVMAGGSLMTAKMMYGSVMASLMAHVQDDGLMKPLKPRNMI